MRGNLASNHSGPLLRLAKARVRGRSTVFTSTLETSPEGGEKSPIRVPKPIASNPRSFDLEPEANPPESTSSSFLQNLPSSIPSLANSKLKDTENSLSLSLPLLLPSPPPIESSPQKSASRRSARHITRRIEASLVQGILVRHQGHTHHYHRFQINM